MKTMYLFDVDDTLEFSRGPVTLTQLVNLKRAGHIIGVCGNWGLFTSVVQGWETLLSLFGPVATSKASYMIQIKLYVHADRYVLIGNVPIDMVEARDAGWEFIKESDFKEGI